MVNINMLLSNKNCNKTLNCQSQVPFFWRERWSFDPNCDSLILWLFGSCVEPGQMSVDIEIGGVLFEQWKNYNCLR